MIDWKSAMPHCLFSMFFGVVLFDIFHYMRVLFDYFCVMACKDDVVNIFDLLQQTCIHNPKSFIFVIDLFGSLFTQWLESCIIIVISSRSIFLKKVVHILVYVHKLRKMSIRLNVDLAQCVHQIQTMLQIIFCVELFFLSSVYAFEFMDLISLGWLFFHRAAMIP